MTIKIKWVIGVAVLSSAVFFMLLAFKLAQIGLVASWSWWAVFAPLWVPVVVVSGVVFVVLGIALFMDVVVVPIRSWLRTRETLRRMDGEP